MTRIFQPLILVANSIISLNEAASHHLSRVLRAEINDEITLFDGSGGEYAAKIVKIDKKQVTVKIENFNAREVESPLNLTLAQGISRGEKMDYTIQKAVELGVKKIVPVFTERCNVKLDAERSEKRLTHWQSIVISACEQSGRNRLPEICSPLSFEKYIAQEMAEIKFILSPYATEKITSNIGTKNIALLIGPEGGLSDVEVQLAGARGFKPIRLGPRILRTETAGIAAIAMLQSWFGDL